MTTKKEYENLVEKLVNLLFKAITTLVIAYYYKHFKKLDKSKKILTCVYIISIMIIAYFVDYVTALIPFVLYISSVLTHILYLYAKDTEVRKLRKKYEYISALFNEKVRVVKEIDNGLILHSFIPYRDILKYHAVLEHHINRKIDTIEQDENNLRLIEIMFKVKQKKVISYKEILMTTELNQNKNMIIGLEKNNCLHVLNIKKIYHSIIAGSTGYGKSNLSHVLLSSIIASDLDLSMFLFDPKKSELKRYRDIRRVFYTGDHDKILETLKFLVKEMDRRNKLIEEDKFVNNLETYNLKYPNNKMCYIVVFIEEIADLMLSSDKEYSTEFQRLITRLSQLGRSTGIRLLLSTQYPKAEVLPTLIKNNCITRFGFAVSNSTESGVVMDSNILTELRKKGEMYLKNEGLTKIQVPLLEDKHIIEIISYLEQRHNKIGLYGLGEKLVSLVSSTENTGTETCHEEISDIIPEKEIIIDSSDDLLEFYRNHCSDGEIFSLNKTVEMVNIGRTKLQRFRKELIERGSLEYNQETKKTYLGGN